MEQEEKMQIADHVKQEVGESSSTCMEENFALQNDNAVHDMQTENNEDATQSPTTGEEPQINPWTCVKCVFCNQSLCSGDNPKLMECLHTACSSCIATKLNEQLDGEIVENNVVICPVCRVHCHASNLIENQFLLEAGVSIPDANSSDKTTDLKCTTCPESPPATSWCVQCAEFICDGCVEAHQRFKITKEHTIKPKEEADTENQESVNSLVAKSLHCSLHSQETLSLFCETCDRLTCRDCQLSDHRDHKYKFIHEIAEETKSVIGGLLSEVSYKRVLLTSAMKVIDDRQNLIMEKKKALVKDITQMVVKLTNAITVRGKQLVLQLNEVCEAKHKTLKEKKMALEQLSNLTDHCIEFVNNALNRGSDMALLYSKRTVTHHLQRIKSRRADIPNPEIPVRIGLVLDKVPDLLKVVSGIGSVVVDGRPYSSPQQQLQQQQQQVQVQSTPPPPPYPQQQVTVARALTTPPAPPLVPMGSPAQPHRVSPHPQQQQQQQQQAARTVPVSRHPGFTQHAAAHLHHQQVTSSTHPHTLGVDASTANLRGLLSHHQMQVPTYPAGQAGPLIRVNVSAAQNGMGYRMPQGPVYPAQLLPPPPRYALQQQQQQQQQQHMYQMHSLQRQHAVAYNSAGAAARPVVQPRTQAQSPHSSNHLQQQQQQQQPPLQWHIPQQSGGMVNGGGVAALQQRVAPQNLQVDESFRITLKTQAQAQTPAGPPPQGRLAAGGQGTVTSSVPKTPSPSHARTDDPEKSLDKFCQESVNDLMATIAKLDRNGIEVVPEVQKTGDSPLVDSSTGLDEVMAGSNSLGLRTMPSAIDDCDKSGGNESQKDDPNEDWCAVCMDGGDVLVCCDKCPKVFHTFCHIPKLNAIPDENETWQCMLCTNLREILDAQPTSPSPSERRSRGLNYKDRKVAERIVLEMYCQYEPSLHFREVVSPEVTEYHNVIKKPMSLDIIRRKLDPNDVEHYSNIRELVADIRLIFKNAHLFNAKESQVYQDAKTLEEFFDSLLEKWLPAYAYDVLAGSDEEDLDTPPQRKYRRILSE